jgi:spore coat protein CotH
MKFLFQRLIAFQLVLCASTVFAAELTLDDIFPSDRVVDIQITLKEKDWDKIRFQTRTFQTALAAERRTGSVPSPYDYVEANVLIDGVEFKKVGLRKKGFIGSQSSLRPSLKVKLNYKKKKGQIGGLTNLTLNNNRQDKTMMSQFMGYALFNAAGSPAPRCSFAKVTVNGVHLGVYSHVEPARKPLIQRGFGDDTGTLYEGTVTDFFAGWEGSFENKVGKDKPGRAIISQLTKAMEGQDGESILNSNARGRGLVPTDDVLEKKWTQPDFDDSNWKAGKNGAGFETQSGFESLISSEFDLEDELYMKNASVYLRFPFDVEDAAALAAKGNLYLKMKYDDGFVAYLNGHEITRANAPEELAWNSNATSSHDDRVAMRFQPFDISAHKDKLRNGRNVLAIHGMNINMQSTDMLIVAELETNKFDYEEAIGKFVDLDDFYQFWVLEGLVGFWDGYSGNRNNFFVYHNPMTEKLHFMPWGADCMFEKASRLGNPPGAPVSVKTNGMIAHKLYQLKSGRERYLKTMKEVLDKHWNEESLLAEMDRVQAMILPHMSEAQELSLNTEKMREFIMNRRADIEAETADGMPLWSKTLGEPPAIEGPQVGRQRKDSKADTIWNVARQGDIEGIKRHLEKGVDVNAPDRAGVSPISAAAFGGQLDAVEFLISQGGKVDSKARDNRTALHRAAYLGRIEIIDLLLNNGANVNAKNNRGETPLDVANTEWRFVQEQIEFLADNLRMKISLKQVKAGRTAAAKFLIENGGKSARPPVEKDPEGEREANSKPKEKPTKEKPSNTDEKKETVEKKSVKKDAKNANTEKKARGR